MRLSPPSTKAKYQLKLKFEVLCCFLEMRRHDLYLAIGKTTRTCATCGGDSVCLIDCGTGTVVKKYKQPGETFYCLAWTTVNMDMGNGLRKRTNLLAAGGTQKDIKIIEPTQLVCFEEIRGHRQPLDSLMFHPGHPTWLLSSADDSTIMVWEVVLPRASTFDSKSK